MKLKSTSYKTEHKITVEQTGKEYTRFNDNCKVNWCVMTKEIFKNVNTHTAAELERAYQSQLQNLL